MRRREEIDCDLMDALNLAKCLLFRPTRAEGDRLSGPEVSKLLLCTRREIWSSHFLKFSPDCLLLCDQFIRGHSIYNVHTIFSFLTHFLTVRIFMQPPLLSFLTSSAFPGLMSPPRVRKLYMEAPLDTKLNTKSLYFFKLIS